MTDFHGARDEAAAQHAAWSAAERERLTKDPDAIGEAIQSGAINELTAEDREALIALFGAPRRPPAAPPARQALREPSPLEPASKPVSPRQSWTEGEFYDALCRAVLFWATALFGGLLVLLVLRAWEHM